MKIDNFVILLSNNCLVIVYKDSLLVHQTCQHWPEWSRPRPLPPRRLCYQQQTPQTQPEVQGQSWSEDQLGTSGGSGLQPSRGQGGYNIITIREQFIRTFPTLNIFLVGVETVCHWWLRRSVKNTLDSSLEGLCRDWLKEFLRQKSPSQWAAWPREYPAPWSMNIQYSCFGPNLSHG